MGLYLSALTNLVRVELNEEERHALRGLGVVLRSAGAEGGAWGRGGI